MKNVVVIGGGPAGIMAAGAAARRGASVTLLEKNDRLGRKLYITGKGRCNITNASDPETLIQNVATNARFMYPSFYAFGSDDVIRFFKDLGLVTKVERGGRVFPASDKSSDVVDALGAFLKKARVNTRLGCKARGVLIKNGKVIGVKTASGETVGADAAVVSTGGMSYPLTGSDGDGYRFAKESGHTISPPRPSLTPIIVKERFDLEGLSLRNVEITAKILKKIVYKSMGEMVFTARGVSGPLILTLSRVIIGKYGLNPEINIDLKPALTERELDARVLRDFTDRANRDFGNGLDGLLPRKIIPAVIDVCDIPPGKKIRDITKEERAGLVRALKGFKLTAVGSGGFDEAIVTKGGVNVSEVKPATMESRLVGGLYFAGETLDVDGFTGGYNLQIAFSTGWAAGDSAGGD
ncbi:MAG: NAD(P)/FAD-dependent oxidoreductase [Clostridiales bacterium]|jgi:predicted Rossmann fold flavoprotein|nr:NAD(P)/FAD-dependent oxidoreductase [Clostridiales bacterium]